MVAYVVSISVFSHLQCQTCTLYKFVSVNGCHVVLVRLGSLCKLSDIARLKSEMNKTWYSVSVTFIDIDRVRYSHSIIISDSGVLIQRDGPYMDSLGLIS